MQNEETGSPVLATTKQESETESKWDWVEATVWTGAMLAALENGVKGGKWFSLMDKVYRMKTLKRAWEHVRKRRGSHGVDGVSIARFEAKREVFLQELHVSLQNGSYRPLPVKRVHIPKSGGGKRPLGIPAIKDRVVQTALKMVIEPIFEKEFAENSYGFRPKRGCKMALKAVTEAIESGKTWVVDADIASYFDTISHDILIELVGEHISDGKVLSLIRLYLQQAVLTDLTSWTPVQGTPQGAVISPLLANLYLHALDRRMSTSGHSMIRFADDFVILCETQSEAEACLSEVQHWVEKRGLSLHPEKTHLGNCMETGEGFEFLGYRFECGKRWVRKKSLHSLKDKIRKKTRRTRGESMASIIAELNPMLKGWFNYFKHAHRWTFERLDKFIRRRLRSLRYKQQTNRTNSGRTYALHRQMPLKYFADLGLFTMKEAHRLACQSR